PLSALKFLKKKQYSNNAPVNLRLMTAHIISILVCPHSAVHSVTRLLRNVNTPYPVSLNPESALTLRINEAESVHVTGRH
ncbi:hypothetical protein CEXT_7841, partial [Caerostris extrusa]